VYFTAALHPLANNRLNTNILPLLGSQDAYLSFPSSCLFPLRSRRIAADHTRSPVLPSVLTGRSRLHEMQEGMRLLIVVWAGSRSKLKMAT
jgi:hypothetical protein